MNGSDDRAADKERSLSNAVVHLIDPELSFALGPEPDRHLDLERDLGSFRKANDLAVSHIKQSLPPFEGSVELHSVPGLSGNPDVAVIRYLQKNSEFHDAVMIWVHGGGFIAGTADDPVVHRFAPLMQVISVEYRLAPEHRAPAAVHDVVAVVQWVHDQASFLGIDQSRIVLAGASAGGGIAASAALSIRDRKGPQLLHQFLIYPMLDDQHNTTSGQFDLPRTTWTRALSLQAWSMYVEDGGPTQYSAASRADDLRGLPPAYLMTGGLDLFRDENIDYARRLMNAGIPVDLAVFPGAVHAFDVLAPQAAVSRRSVFHQISALKHALARKV